MLDTLYLEYSFLGLTKEKVSEIIKKGSINEYIKKHKSILLNIEDLDKLSILDLDIEDYIYILKNNKKVYSFIEKLYKENKEVNSPSLNNFICAYKLLNNIDISLDIENDDSFYNEDFYTEDTYKQLMFYIRNYKVLTTEEVNELCIRMSKGDDEARNLLILHNIKLVVYVAKKYSSYNIDLLDLIQEGIIGLMKAVEKYDYTKGYRFSSYAYFWIEEHIDRELSYFRSSIKIPAYLDIKLTEFKKRRNELEQKLGRHLSNQELSEMLNMKLSVIEELTNIDDGFISLNSKVFEDYTEEIQDKLISDINIEEEVILSSLSTELLEAFEIAGLSPIEIYILTKKFKNSEESVRTLAKDLGLTFQRVSQIQIGALEKLKKPEVIKKLHLYYKEEELKLTINLKDNFLEYFDGSFFKVLYVIRNLSEKDKSLLFSLYDKDTLNLLNKNITDDSFITLINKIKNKIPKKDKSISNLLTYFSDYPKEEVIEVIENLSKKDKTLLFSFYNENYILIKRPNLLDIKTIIDKIEKKLIKRKITLITSLKNLPKYLGISKEEMMNIKRKYNLTSLYNEELTDYIVSDDKSYLEFYNTLKSLFEIKDKLCNLTYYNDLLVALNVSSNILKEKISLLNQKYIRILMRVYKEGFTNGNVRKLHKEEKLLFRESIRKLIELLNEEEKSLILKRK